MLTEAQRLDRINGIGASESPIIMGYSTYKSPYELYLEKTGVVSEEDEEPTEQQYWGNALEPLIIKRFSEENGVEVTFPDTVYHPEYPYIFANLDGWIESEKAVVECKCANSFQRSQWDMAASDGIPLVYLIQIAKQCAITDASRGYCAVLIGGMEYRQFVYERDAALEALIIEADKDFWHRIQNRIEPDPISTSDCRLKFKKSNPAKVVEATFNSTRSLKELSAIKAQLKALSIDEDKCKMDIMVLMKDAEYMLGQEGEVLATWKGTKKGNRVLNIK
jgi:putative phage-type endonuclease